MFWGLLDRTMLLDDGRAFLEAGGLFEDADMVLRMLRVAVPARSLEGDGGHESEALALLQAVGGFQAFRRSVRQTPDLRRVVRFLLFERAYRARSPARCSGCRTPCRRPTRRRARRRRCYGSAG